ncbi:hypothetical protein SASPL_137991 [Salvia splendens]|uniref:Pentatricopeptide repeat-containing protein n=1 Tax=Salvia splendens TaxID=180675 RepID=A0A8X8WW92_SALSN|nr:hypothetical protein SASPL_137991 [Salvia splendens]
MAEIENEDEFSSEDSYENVEVTEKVGSRNGDKFNSLKFKEELHSITTPEIAIQLSNNSSSTLGGGSNPDMDDVDVDDAVWNKSIGVLQGKILDIGHNVAGYPRADGLAVAEGNGLATAYHLEFGGWKKYLNFRDELLKDTQGSLRVMNARNAVAIHTAPKVLHKWKSKNVRKAQEIFDKMKNDQFCPDPKSYNILIEGWGRAPNLPKAREIFNEMVDSGCNFLCKAGRTDEALGVVKEMEIENRIEDDIDAFLQLERNGVNADVAVYNSSISAFCKVNKLENAYKVVDEMDKKGVSPNSRTCNILINSLIGRGETDCSKLLHRRPFFKLSVVVLEFGNRMNGGIEQALHKIEVPKHRTERVEIDNGIVKLTLMNPGGLITSVGYNGVDNILEYSLTEDRRGLVVL